ncbi:MAG: V-type ATP synthase subunit E [Firmicutes bacterium]|nr:V-type ATP synthase subunit E [Bacillota bacterium]
MNNENEKVGKFLQAINDYAEEQRKKILDEVRQYYSAEIERAEKEALSDAQQLVEREKAQNRNRIRHEISRREMEAKKQLISHRANLVDGVFHDVARRLQEYTRTPEYEKFLKTIAEELSNVLSDVSSELYIRREDEAYIPLIREVFGDCEIRFSDEIRLGGILGVSRYRGIVADETLDSRLEAQRTWFAANSGLTIN